MTNVQTNYDPLLKQEDPQALQPGPDTARKTILLLGLLAITGATWWTLQDRNDVVDATPAIASTEPLPAPIDEAPLAPLPTTAARPIAKSPTPGPTRDASLIASSQVLPKYPASALRAGETGTVLVLASIDRNGVPIEVSLDDRSGNREFDRSALQAVRQWRFQPALRDGKPVATSVRVPVEFALERG
ncbi:MAG TPA: energy transducer TonB [Thermomonas sp.]|jgi:protein TonB|uniref:energy transducer TonB n=1 Tax=Thermomonas sp. TaxID=1971895 RepID=UPI002CD9A9F7|nr:energy transducer TonB [Thermomonas sp.]HPW12497.1 energy transducer TonB [Thermomonas sp.]